MNETSGTGYRIAFVIEGALGHITHMQSIMRWVRQNGNIIPEWMQIPYETDDFLEKIPKIPFSIKLSARARAGVIRLLKQRELHCLYYHTQALTLFSAGLMKKIPVVISLDATPINFDSIAQAYDSKTSTGFFYQIKKLWFRRVFRNASLIVTFSDWAKNSLIQDYRINPEKIIVIPPGVDITKWKPNTNKTRSARTKLLFVGGDFKRKGGEILLDAFRTGLSDVCELDIVTSDKTIIADDTVHVHNGLTPNSKELINLFVNSDIFIMPTEGDASPFVILEAMASSLPVITTKTGAVDEIIEDSVSGFLIPKSDPAAIVKTVLSLTENPDRLEAMGREGRLIVEKKYNAETNYMQLLKALEAVASGTVVNATEHMG